MAKIRIDGNGVHFYERSTGLNVLLDEIRPPRAQWSEAPRNVSIALTNVCDLRCHFCYVPKSSQRLEAKEVLDWTRQLDDLGCLSIGFGGGEPTLFPDFGELCAEVALTTRLAVTFTTHAHNLDPRIADQLRGRVNFIRVSVDAVGATYESLRGRPFARLVEQLGLVRTIAPFGINFLVNGQTLSHLDQVAELAAVHGAEELLLLPELDNGHVRLDASQKSALTEWVRCSNRQMRLSISELGVEPDMPIASAFTTHQPLESHAHIDAFGRLKANAFSGIGVHIGTHVHEALKNLRNISENGHEDLARIRL